MMTRRDASRARWFWKPAAVVVLLIGLIAASLPLITWDQVRADSFPSPPGTVQVFANPPGQVCASWSPIDGANQYKIFDASGNFIASAAVANTPKCLPDAVGTCLMVSAVTSGGETARSAPTCINTAPPTPLPQPTPLPTPIPLPTTVPTPQPSQAAPVYSPPLQPAAPVQPVAPVASTDPPVSFVSPDPVEVDPGR